MLKSSKRIWVDLKEALETPANDFTIKFVVRQWMGTPSFVTLKPCLIAMVNIRHPQRIRATRVRAQSTSGGANAVLLYVLLPLDHDG